MECVICLDDISCNAYSKFNCCNNSVHNHCLNEWVVKNIDNKNVAKCFICSQTNNAIISVLVLYCVDETINSISNNSLSNNSLSTNSLSNNSLSNNSLSNNSLSNNSLSNNSLSNNNNYNYIIIDISNNILSIQPYIETRSFFFFKIFYSMFAVSILVLGFIYISL